MATAARLPLAADRYTSCVRTIRFRGLDLTGKVLRMQVRLQPDTPGAPLVDLGVVTNANEQGLRILPVETDGGVQVTPVVMRINETTMKGLPYAGEVGDASVLAYDLIGTFGVDKRRLVYGDFPVIAGVTGSDAAPTGRAAGYGASSAAQPWSAAALTFDGDTVEITIDGYDLIQPFIERAEAAAEFVQATADQLDRISQDAPIGPLISGERPIREVRSETGELIESTTAEGNLWIDTPTGMRRVGTEVASAAPVGPLVGGETPLFVETSQGGAIVRVETVEGGRWVTTPEGLVRTTPARPSPTRYAGPAFVQGIDQVVRASPSTGVWYLLVTLGQSNAMAENSNPGDAIVAANPIYPANAWMFEGGPRRDDALPNRKLVPLIETPNGLGQRETEASGWANHFIRDVEAATGTRPNTLSVVTALGGMPYMALSRGTPTYANFLRAVDDAVAAIRAAGGTRIVTVFSWTQGPSDASGVGFMNASRRVREMQQYARQIRGDVMERTGEVETPSLFIVNETNQPFADPWFGPIRDADQLLDGDDHMRLVGPMYFLPYTDMYHATCRGQNRKGQMVARACVAEMFAQGWRPVRPVASRWEGGMQFVVDFDMAIPPLVLDASGAVVSVAGLEASGFLFDDGSGAAPAILSITVVPSGPYPGMALRFVLAAMPTGPRARLGYAIRRDASQVGDYPGQSGPVTGPRGLLRDSAAHVSLYDGSPQANWAPPFVIEL